MEQQILGDSSENELAMQNKTAQDIQNLAHMVENNKQTVIDLLIGMVCDVRPTLHENFQGAAWVVANNSMAG